MRLFHQAPPAAVLGVLLSVSPFAARAAVLFVLNYRSQLTRMPGVSRAWTAAMCLSS